MEKVKGVITAVSQKEDKYGIAMGTGNWFNGYGKAPCNKGDEVEITYQVNNNFKNIDQVYVSTKTTESEVPSDSNKYNLQMSKLKNKTNARICALTCAKDMVEKGSQPEVVINLAKQYVDWIYQE